MLRERYRRVGNEKADHIVQSLGLKNVKIVVSPDVFVPYVTGFTNARIYLPEIAIDDCNLEMILKHEYTHFKSRDVYIKAFYVMFSVIFWWNPIVHVFMRELDRLLELRCDAAMTKRMYEEEKTLYMETLVIISKHIVIKDAVKLTGASALVQAKPRGFMEQRFRLIESVRSVKSVVMQIASVTLVVLVFLTSYMFIIQPVYLPPSEDFEGTFTLSPGNMYFICTHEGKYMLYIDGQPIDDFDEDIVKSEDFSGVPIIYEED